MAGVGEHIEPHKGREYLRSLKLSGVKDCLDTIDFLDTKIQETMPILIKCDICQLIVAAANPVC